MSSLNPFAARREKKEAQIKDRLEHMQASGELPEFAKGGSSGEMLTEEQLQAMLPPDSGSQYEQEDFGKYLPASAKVEQPTQQWSVPGGGGGYEGPSRTRQCMSRLQSAFMIGGSLGGAVGFMYGTYAAFAYKHVLYVPIAVLQFGGGFGFFLACGSVIRCDEPKLLHASAPLEPTPLPYVARARLIGANDWDAVHKRMPCTPELEPRSTRCAIVEAVCCDGAPRGASRWLA